MNIKFHYQITLLIIIIFNIKIRAGGEKPYSGVRNIEDLIEFNKFNTSSHFKFNYDLLEKVNGRIEKYFALETRKAVEKFGELIIEEMDTFCVEFNTNEKITKITCLHSRKGKGDLALYFYDNGGNLIELYGDGRFKFYYNENNLLIKQDHLGKNEILLDRYIFKYDSKNNPIELIQYDENGELKHKTTRFYNNNLLMEENNTNKYYDLSHLKQIKKYNYDLKGRKIYEEEVKINKNIKHSKSDSYYTIKRKFYYNSTGNKLSIKTLQHREEIYSDYNTSPCKINFVYPGNSYKLDKNGNCVETSESNSITEKIYDKFNNLIEIISDNGDISKFKYNQNNICINEKHFSKSKLESTKEFTYDSNGLLLTEESKKFEEHNAIPVETESNKKEYTYDKNRNIVIKKEYKNGKIERVEKMIYVYFQ